jgi:LPXTG-motif cell wall-anchored protein
MDTDHNQQLDQGDTKLGAPQVTAASGLTAWAQLLNGDYLVEETAAPTGYSMPPTTVLAVSINDANSGGTMQVVFRDPANGQLAIVAKRQFELNGAGEWVLSDGKVDFGDQVKYEIAILGTGPKLFHDVTVRDYIPGYDPQDTTTTTKATYVPGTAQCVQITCTVNVDAATGLITWTAGTVSDVDGWAEFVVKVPDLPAAPAFDADGNYTESVWNVALLNWREADTTAPAVGGISLTDHSVRSNEVTAEATIKVKGEEIIVPQPKPKPRPPVVLGLPDTGAPQHGGLVGLLGALIVGLGAWLTTRSRRGQTVRHRG